MDVNFYLRSIPDKNGDCAIRISISSKGVRLQTSTGYKISSKMWEKDMQRVRRGAINAKGMPYNLINAALDNIKAHFGRIDDIRTPLTKEELQQELDHCLGRSSAKEQSDQKNPEVANLIRTFMTEAGNRNGWSLSTIAKFTTLRNHLEKYSPQLKIKDLDRACLTGLVLYFLNLGFINSTISKQIKLLQWFLRWAEDNEYQTAADWHKFSSKLKQPEKTIVFLDWNELMEVYDYPVPQEKQYLSRVRDVFCFCCFTSLRYSDVANLHRSDIFPDFIRITTVKTADTIEIDLNDFSRAILQKYEGERYPGDLALPVISSQRMNEYLRELCKMVGLTTPIRQVYFSGGERIEEVKPKYEYITTHCGRRTFICNALALGVPTEIVMKWTGHSDYNAMKPYIAISDKVRAEEMKRFNKRS